MNRTKAWLAISPVLMLVVACGQAQNAREDARDVRPSSSAAGLNAGAAAPAASGIIGAGSPDLTPPRLTPEAERGEKGARNVLLSFARAIELEEYGQAWAMLAPADQRKLSNAQFAAIFAGLDAITVAVPTGTMEGAAGSSYYSAPITITASDRVGRPVRMTGKVVLRRVNDVDGASPEQRRWHFETVTLDWTH